MRDGLYFCPTCVDLQHPPLAQVGFDLDVGGSNGRSMVGRTTSPVSPALLPAVDRYIPVLQRAMVLPNSILFWFTLKLFEFPVDVEVHAYVHNKVILNKTMRAHLYINACMHE